MTDQHYCPKGTHRGVPNSRFKIESWNVCFGGRVTGLMDYLDGGKLVSHVEFCPFCGAPAHVEPTPASQ